MGKMGENLNKPCPICRGRAFEVNPRSHAIGGCSTCNGTGRVDIEHRCMCGRPAVIPIADTVVCTRKECSDRALGIVPELKVQSSGSCLC